MNSSPRVEFNPSPGTKNQDCYKTCCTNRGSGGGREVEFNPSPGTKILVLGCRGGVGGLNSTRFPRRNQDCHKLFWESWFLVPGEWLNSTPQGLNSTPLEPGLQHKFFGNLVGEVEFNLRELNCTCGAGPQIEFNLEEIEFNIRGLEFSVGPAPRLKSIWGRLTINLEGD